MLKTLYVTDLDGTLLHSRDGVSPYAASVVNGLIRRGAALTYATARSLTSARIVTEGLAFNAPAAVYNGAFVRHSRTGETFESCFFDAEDAAAVRGVLERLGLFPLCYALKDAHERVSWMREADHEGLRRYIQLRAGDPRLLLAADTDELYRGSPFYFTLIGERGQLLPAYRELKKNPRLRCVLQQELYRPEYWLEIMPARASKAAAVQKLRELLGCGRVVSFGDSVNDIPMFQVSDVRCAVSNAAPELKELATEILPSNDEDGVAHWLEEHVRA